MKYIKDRHRVTPDKLFIREWGLDEDINNAPNITFALIGEVLHLSKDVHPRMYSRNRLGEGYSGFDGRIYTNKKVMMFWQYGTENTLQYVLKVIDKVCFSDFKSDVEVLSALVDFRPQDYVFIYLVEHNNEPYICKCSYDDLKNLARDPNYKLSDTSSLRPFHLLPPQIKLNFVTHEEKKTLYNMSCGYWAKRIGNMDVAEWHLLMYEE